MAPLGCSAGGVYYQCFLLRCGRSRLFDHSRSKTKSLQTWPPAFFLAKTRGPREAEEGER